MSLKQSVNNVPDVGGEVASTTMDIAKDATVSFTDPHRVHAAAKTANGAITIQPTSTLLSNTSSETSASNIWAFRRAGNIIRNAIFFCYEDCKEWIEIVNNANTAPGMDQIEYSTFQNMADAVRYLRVNVDLSANESGSSAATTNRNPVSSKKDLMVPFKTRTRIKAANNPNRRPTKAWDKMFEKLKEYMNKNGTTNVADTPENEALFKWRKQQDIEYKNLLDGKGSSMFQAKIDMLESIGHQFTYVSVEDKYAALLTYKHTKGNYNVPSTHPVLGKWMEKHRNCARKLAKNETSSYFDLKFKEFAALGVNIGIPMSSEIPLTSEETQAKDHDENWDHYYEKLVAFKREHGNLDITPDNDGSIEGDELPLSAWVKRQHQEYQKIQDRKASKLTLARVQRLTDLGFVFQQRKQSIKWEDRLKQLKRYKLKNGHVRVPKSNPELGVFVNRQRYEYSKLMQGKPSSLTPSRLTDLRELGFVFVAGKTPKPTEKKTWDARYQELVDYKNKHGHCMVAQKAGLGEWVHSQRLYYRKLKQGKKSPLTPERLLMLANVGFVFDATKRRGNGNSQQNINVENNIRNTVFANMQQNKKMPGIDQAHVATGAIRTTTNILTASQALNPPRISHSQVPPVNFKRTHGQNMSSHLEPLSKGSGIGNGNDSDDVAV